MEGMSSPSVPLTGLLPDGSAWSPVTDGESGATMLRHSSGGRFAKVVSAAAVSTLEAERDRIEWLSGTGIPGPRVLDWRATEHSAALITSAVAGVPADRLNPAQLAQAWPSITDTLHRLHSLPASTCPFSRTLDEMMGLARATVAENRVHAEFLPQHLINTPPTVILDGLERDLPLRREQEAADTVVCHGDFCLPNILINSDTSLVAGIIDLGRLGHADPYADIALLLANARETWPDEDTARQADHDFASQYGITLDPERLDFYLRLDPLTW
ncbi:APH(3'') family aminoglycoside O-phosphotransferase [Brevibacterium casei]